VSGHWGKEACTRRQGDLRTTRARCSQRQREKEDYFVETRVSTVTRPPGRIAPSATCIRPKGVMPSWRLWLECPLHGPAVTQDSLAARSATRVAAGPNDSQWSAESSELISLHTCSLWFLSETKAFGFSPRFLKPRGANAPKKVPCPKRGPKRSAPPLSFPALPLSQ
jgi:hypothetical protein